LGATWDWERRITVEELVEFCKKRNPEKYREFLRVMTEKGFFKKKF
jgi:hypothetical protein